jgi:hypothetical protein
MIRKSLKSGSGMPISRNGMFPFSRIARTLGLACLVACLGTAEAGKKKAKPEIPVMAPLPKGLPEAVGAPVPSKESEKPAAAAFEELNFNRTLVIEGKVEKPAVQFTLLKEPPPEKEIRFETSFMRNILKLDRENTFKPGETYGRE